MAKQIKILEKEEDRLDVKNMDPFSPKIFCS